LILIWHRMNHSVKRRRQALHQTRHHYYLNISVQVANLSDWRIESNRNFLPELECSSGDGAVRQTWAGPSIRCSATSSDVNRCHCVWCVGQISSSGAVADRLLGARRDVGDRSIASFDVAGLEGAGEVGPWSGG